MKKKLLNLTRQTLIAEAIAVAEGPGERAKGLLGHKTLPDGEGLLMEPCESIHTFFMRFPIDVIFVDAQNRIIKLYHALKPWRISGVYFRAKYCIELPAGTLAAAKTEQGDSIKLE
jgi:uncharacterized protein